MLKYFTALSPATQTRRKHPPLPWDVLVIIVNDIPITQLYPLLLAFRSLKEAAEAFLYRHINLANCATRSLLLFRTLLASTRHCELVRSFHPATETTEHGQAAVITRRILRASNLDRFRKSPTMEARLALGVDVSNRLVNVQELTLQSHSLPNLKFDAFSNLKKLSLAHPCFFYLGPDLDLNILPDLTHLEIPMHPFQISRWTNSKFELLAEDRLRNLDTLACPVSLAVRIVPGRPIKRLCITMNTHQHPLVPLEVLNAIGKSTEKITVLGLALGWDWQESIVEILWAVTRLCPHVEKWHLMVDFATRSEYLMLPFTQNLPYVLLNLRSLRVLNLKGTTGDVIPYLDPKRSAPARMYLAALGQWRSACATLQEVVLPNGSDWEYEEVTMRWQHRTIRSKAPRWNQEGEPFYERMECVRSLSTPMFAHDLKRRAPEE